MNKFMGDVTAIFIIIFIMLFKMDDKHPMKESRSLPFAEHLTGQKTSVGMIPWYPEESNHHLNIKFSTPSIYQQFNFIDGLYTIRKPELPEPKQEFGHGRDYFS